MRRGKAEDDTQGEQGLFSRAPSLHGDPDKSRAKRFKPLSKPHCVSVPLQIVYKGHFWHTQVLHGKNTEINLHRHQRFMLLETEVLALSI